MTKLAVEFGISDVGLKMVCDRHRVPAPPRGYWAKLKAGQKPKRALFVEVKDAQLNRIEINPQIVDLPESVRQNIDAQKAERSLALKPRRSPKSVTLEPVIDVHPAVRKTAQALRRCKPTDDAAHASGDGLCGVSVGRESIERAVFVLDQLARLLAEKNIPLAPTGKAMEVAAKTESAVMVLKERTRMTDHHPTAEELAEEARRQEQLDRHWRNPARYPRPQHGRAYPDKDTVWTGELSLQIEGYCDGVRRKWADGQTQRLEDLVPSIANGVEVLLAARKAEREAREERDRRYADLERRRRLAKAWQEREKLRIAFFDGLVALRRGADDLRKALQEIESDGRSIEGIQMSRMMAWGKGRLREMEDKLQAKQIEHHLIEAKLFPAEGEDDLYDPLGEPPTGSSYW